MIVESPLLRERALGEWEGQAGQEYFKALIESGESRIWWEELWKNQFAPALQKLS